MKKIFRVEIKSNNEVGNSASLFITDCFHNQTRFCFSKNGLLISKSSYCSNFKANGLKMNDLKGFAIVEAEFLKGFFLHIPIIGWKIIAVIIRHLSKADDGSNWISIIRPRELRQKKRIC